MKKLLHIVLCFALIFTLIPGTAAAKNGPGQLYWLDASTVSNPYQLGDADWNAGEICGEAGVEKEYYFAAIVEDEVILITDHTTLVMGDDDIAAIVFDDGNGRFKLEFRSSGSTWIRAEIDPGHFELEIDVSGGNQGGGNDGPSGPLPGQLYWAFAENVAGQNNLNNPENWNNGRIQGEAGTTKRMCFASIEDGVVTVVNNPSAITFGDNRLIGIPGGSNHEFDIAFKGTGNTWMSAVINGAVYELGIAINGGSSAGQIFWAEADKVAGNVTVDSLNNREIWHTSFGAQPGVTLQVYFVAVENGEVVWINDPTRITTTNGPVARISGRSGNVLTVIFENSGEAVFSTRLNGVVYELPVTVSGGDDGPSGPLPGQLYWAFAEDVDDESSLNNPEEWNSGKIHGEAGIETGIYFAAIENGQVTFVDRPSMIQIDDRNVVQFNGGNNHRFNICFMNPGETWMQTTINGRTYEAGVSVVGGNQGGGNQQDPGPVRLYDSQGNLLEDNAVFLSQMEEGTFYFALVMNQIPEDMFFQIEDKYNSMARGGYRPAEGIIDLDAGIITVTPVDVQDAANTALIKQTGLADSNMQYQLFKAEVDNDKFKENTYLKTGYMSGWISFGTEMEDRDEIFVESEAIAIFTEDFQPEPWKGKTAENLYFADARDAEGPMQVKLLKMYQQLDSEDNAVYLMTGRQMTPETLTVWLTYEHRGDRSDVIAYQRLPENALSLERGQGFYKIQMNSFYGHNDILLQAAEGDAVAQITLKKAVQYKYKTDGIEMLEDAYDYLPMLAENHMEDFQAGEKVLFDAVLQGEYSTRMHADKNHTRSANRPYNGGYFGAFLGVADNHQLTDIQCTGFDGEGNPAESHLFYQVGQNFYFLAYNPNGSMQGVEELYRTSQNMQVSHVRGSYALVETRANLAEYVYNEEEEKYQVQMSDGKEAVAKAVLNLKTWADQQGYELTFVDASMYYDIGIAPNSGYETIDEFYTYLDRIGTVEFVTEPVDRNDAFFGEGQKAGIKASDQFSEAAWGEDAFEGFLQAECDEDALILYEEAIAGYYNNLTSSQVISAYDFQMEENAPFQGMADVYIPVPEGVDPETCRIYWIHEGTPVPMPCRYVDGYMVFTTSHFSEYALVSNPADGFCIYWDGQMIPDGGTITVTPGALLDGEIYYGGKPYEGPYPQADSSDENLINPGASPDGKWLQGWMDADAQEGDSCWVEIYYGENLGHTARFKVVAGKPAPTIELKLGDTIVRPTGTFGSGSAETTVEILLGGEKIPAGYHVGTNGNSAVCDVRDNGDGTFTIINNGNGDCNIIVDFDGMQCWYTWHVAGFENAACNLVLECGGEAVLPGGYLTLAGHNVDFTGKIYCNGAAVSDYTLTVSGPPGSAEFGLVKNNDGTFTIMTPEEDGYTQLVLEYVKNNRTYKGRIDVQVQTPERYVFQFHTVEPDGEGGYEPFGYATMSVFKQWSQEKYYKFVITDEDMHRVDRDHFVAATPENLELYVYDKRTGEYVKCEESPFTITAMDDGSGILKITYDRLKDFNGPAYMLKFTGDDKYLDNEAGIPTEDTVFIWTKTVREMADWNALAKEGRNWRYDGTMSKHQGMAVNDECTVKQTEIVIPDYFFGEEETQIQTGDATLEIETELGSIMFDQLVLQQIDHEDEDIALTILDVEPEDEEYQNVAEALAGLSCIVDLKLQAGEGRISDFGDGWVTVRLPYVMSQRGQDEGRTPYVYYVDSNGVKHLMTCQYDEENCEIWFVTNHFSLFAVEEMENLGEVSLLGDVNMDGKVNAADLTRLARYVAKLDLDSDTISLANSDVNGDKLVNALDLTRLARYISKIITVL